MLDVRVLTRVLRAVEESVDEQEVVLSPKQKAQLIAHLYDVAIADWTLLDQMVVDRMVWMGEIKEFGPGICARESV